MIRVIALLGLSAALAMAGRLVPSTASNDGPCCCGESCACEDCVCGVTCPGEGACCATASCCAAELTSVAAEAPCCCGPACGCEDCECSGCDSAASDKASDAI